MVYRTEAWLTFFRIRWLSSYRTGGSGKPVYAEIDLTRGVHPGFYLLKVLINGQSDIEINGKVADKISDKGC